MIKKIFCVYLMKNGILSNCKLHGNWNSVSHSLHHIENNNRIHAIVNDATDITYLVDSVIPVNLDDACAVEREKHTKPDSPLHTSTSKPVSKQTNTMLNCESSKENSSTSSSTSPSTSSSFLGDN